MNSNIVLRSAAIRASVESDRISNLSFLTMLTHIESKLDQRLMIIYVYLENICSIQRGINSVHR
jgi:hypothetical protein